MKFKIGHSYDMHALISGRKLILGGIEIEHELGLKGHSDADVLLHAITESLIGAMGLGDIGTFFPDTDPKYKGISSVILLKEVLDILKDNNYKINNIDAIVYAQKPKLNPLIKDIRTNIANILEVDYEDVNIKATTGEKLGYIGREEAIAAESVCLIYREK